MTHITCSLNTTDAARQALDWRALGELALSTTLEDGRFVATFPLEASGDVEALAARETACCAFLSIRTFRTGYALRLEIASTDAEALPVVGALAAVIGR